MAAGRSRFRMPRVMLPTRSRGAGRSRSGKSEAPTETATKETASKENEPKAAAKAAPKPAAGTKATGAKGAATPDPNVQERIEGLQGWMAEIERKQGRMTYFGAAAVLIALAAAGAALYFGLTAKNDSAKKSDLDALTTKVDSLEAAVSKNSKDTQATLNDTVTRLQASIAAIQKQQAKDAATIAGLQAQVAAGALNQKGAGATTGTNTTTTTPGKTKTTP
jgi:uncharacterized protein HemX